jgi:hypothetical protein
MSTMTARYPGTCRGCRKRITPGDLIVHIRRGASYHVDCSGEKQVNTIRTSGGTFYRNARGRCEDAPCCGCCTI